MSGDVQVDVEKLNERLEIRGATRLRHSAIAPDEAYGVRNFVPLSLLSFFFSNATSFAPPHAIAVGLHLGWCRK